MRIVLIGLGVQGHKRRAIAGDSVIATVDPVSEGASHRSIESVPLETYDAALVCTPDEVKVALLRYLLSHGKHVLVEKPLIAGSDTELEELAVLAEDNGVTCYTAYNHRFEPHFVHMKALLDEGSLGHIYSVRMFYGNGTARLVRQSPWRDKGAGVLMDLGSHLLDTCAFWFGSLDHRAATLVSANRFENQAPDHCAFVFPGQPLLQLEMTLLSWRNHFYADVHGEKGSAHIQSLCKWGPSIFTRRNRILPSGRPTEHSVTLVQDDPTWALEYRHFLELTRTGTGNIRNDILLNRTLRHLSRSAPMASPS